MTIKVLIVDDHTVVRQGLRLLMESQPDIAVVGEAAGGEEALNLIKDLAVDVILLDLIMPNMSGLASQRVDSLDALPDFVAHARHTPSVRPPFHRRFFRAMRG